MVFQAQRRALGVVVAVLSGCIHLEQSLQGSLQLGAPASGGEPLVQEAPSLVAVAQEPVLPLVPGVALPPGATLEPALMHGLLDGAGSWRTVESLGTLWLPEPSRVGSNFVPFQSEGRWLSTDRGLYWQAQSGWGFVTSHYGRWIELAGRWAWMPGSAFAPAWVQWRAGNGWVAWAPLPPDGVAPSTRFVACRESALGSTAWASSGCLRGPEAAPVLASMAELPSVLAEGGLAIPRGPEGLASIPVVAMTNAWAAELQTWRSSSGAEVTVAAASPYVSSVEDREVPRTRLRETVSLGFTWDDRARGGGSPGGSVPSASAPSAWGYGSSYGSAMRSAGVGVGSGFHLHNGAYAAGYAASYAGASVGARRVVEPDLTRQPPDTRVWGPPPSQGPGPVTVGTRYLPTPVAPSARSPGFTAGH